MAPKNPRVESEDALANVLMCVKNVWGASPLAGEEGLAVAIHGYLDPISRWTLGGALERGYAGLVCRILCEERRNDSEQGLVDAMLNKRIDEAAVSGDIETLAGFKKYFPGLVWTDASSKAAASGLIHVLHWLYENGPLVCWGQQVFRWGVRRLPVLMWLNVRFRIQPDATLLLVAVDEGLEGVVKWLWKIAIEQKWPVDMLADVASRVNLDTARWMVKSFGNNLMLSLDPASLRGDLAFLRWAHGLGGTGMVDGLDAAAARGNLEVVQWLHYNRTEGCSTEAMDHAAGNGHLDVMEFLHSYRGEGCSSLAYLFAARGGRLQVLIWLTHNSATFTHAAARGHLQTVIWLHENSDSLLGFQVETTTAAMDWAAAGGHLETVIWLHQNRRDGCSSDAMDMAAANGYLYIVQWLHENRAEGCTVSAIDDAAANGHLDVVIWLHENRLEGATTDAMDGAATGGHRDIVFWLQNNRNEGCTSAAVDGAIATGDTELVTWFYANHISCTANGLDRAIDTRNIKMLQFLSRVSAEDCTINGYLSAVRKGRLHIARWVLTRQPCWYDAKDFDRVKLTYGWTFEILCAALPQTLTDGR